MKDENIVEGRIGELRSQRQLRFKLEKKIDVFHDGKPYFPNNPIGCAVGDGHEKTRQLNEIRELRRELGDDGFGGRR